MMKRNRFAIMVLTMCSFLVSMAPAQVPERLLLHGYLTDSGGNPVEGVLSTTFLIYDVPEGGTALWSEIQQVEYAAGLFSSELGNQVPLPDENINAEIYLAMEIGGEELSPRWRMSSSPFSIRAKFVDLFSAENMQQFWQLAQTTPDFDNDGHDKISMGGDDCDDLDPLVYPGADEYCDGKDNDCNGAVDDNTVDCPEGFVCFNLQCVIADADGDGWPFDQDCDDTDPNVYPGAPEICNGIDDDCDGVVDDVDEDNDGYYACIDDCDDFDPGVNPGASEICGDEIDNNCDGQVDEGCPVDNDGDGYTNDIDCDDSDPNVHPGAQEICNGIDDDCDGVVDDVDEDNDGYYACFDDCDDTDPTVHPGAPEHCNGFDENCDGQIDENVVDCPEGTECTGGTCTYIDNDNDGWPYDQDCDDNDPNVHPGAPEICNGIDDDCNGFVDDADNDSDGFNCLIDCDDNDPSVYPGAPELCDGIDNNCNGVVDDRDNDGDGFNGCVDDCDDGDPATYPGAPELCDGIDNDCDGQIDNNVVDNDGDGFGCDIDCNDTDPNVYPGAPEICDGVDNDCSGIIDDIDNDGDGYYGCVDDCDDNNPAVYPGAPELCDGIDNDCDGEVDEGCP